MHAPIRPGRGPLGNEPFDDTSRYAGDAVGLAAIVTAGQLVEVSLQMLAPERAGMRALEPSLQKPDRPVAGLQRVLLSPLGFGLYFRLVGSFARESFRWIWLPHRS